MHRGHAPVKAHDGFLASAASLGFVFLVVRSEIECTRAQVEADPTASEGSVPVRTVGAMNRPWVSRLQRQGKPHGTAP